MFNIVMRFLTSLLIIFLLSGCVISKQQPVIEYGPNTQIINDNISITTPKSFPDEKWIDESGINEGWNNEGDVKKDIWISRFDEKEKIRITRYLGPLSSITSNRFAALENKKLLSEFYSKIDIFTMLESYVFRSKAYFNYIANLKCMVLYEDKCSYYDIYYRVRTNTFATCPYYDKNGNQSFIVVNAKNRYDKFYDKEYTMNKEYKQDLKAILDSLIIYDLDIEKSKKAGMYVEKPYDINAEDKPIVEWTNPERLEKCIHLNCE